LTPSAAISTPKARNNHGGANHTTATARAMSTAPLSTRVIVASHRGLETGDWGTDDCGLETDD